MRRSESSFESFLRRYSTNRENVAMKKKLERWDFVGIKRITFFL